MLRLVRLVCDMEEKKITGYTDAIRELRDSVIDILDGLVGEDEMVDYVCADSSIDLINCTVTATIRVGLKPKGDLEDGG